MMSWILSFPLQCNNLENGYLEKVSSNLVIKFLIAEQVRLLRTAFSYHYFHPLNGVTGPSLHYIVVSSKISRLMQVRKAKEIQFPSQWDKADLHSCEDLF